MELMIKNSIIMHNFSVATPSLFIYLAMPCSTWVPPTRNWTAPNPHSLIMKVVYGHYRKCMKILKQSKITHNLSPFQSPTLRQPELMFWWVYLSIFLYIYVFFPSFLFFYPPLISILKKKISKVMYIIFILIFPLHIISWNLLSNI